MDVDVEHYWAPARERALRDLDRRYGPGTPGPGWAEKQEAGYGRIMAPGWYPERRRGSLPSLWEVASYWAERSESGEWFDVALEYPHCFACGAGDWEARKIPDPEEKWTGCGWWLHTGHLVNWARDGLDQVQNLVPLCKVCNFSMPVFDAEHAADAIRWVQLGGAYDKVQAIARTYEQRTGLSPAAPLIT